ncbi:unnamed protein product [Prunus armeniaca]|uniref:Uncharacterized protein n=1 Tax=Prunus armeniaca TaxID=36596 RepID=A0A6J5UPA6_PRUAR|nr:unnamed protein product [Prunus armeniaca]
MDLQLCPYNSYGKGQCKGKTALLFCLTGNEEFPMSRKGDLFGATSTLLVQLPCMKLEFDGVITLNEPYKTLVPASLYHCHGINRLVIPTRDYCFAPSLNDTCCAADFIHDTNDMSHKTVEAGYTHPNLQEIFFVEIFVSFPDAASLANAYMDHWDHVHA